MITSFITITEPERRGDLFKQCYKQAEKFSDEIIVIDGKDTWPKEFSWELIGQHFQKGYEQANEDWVIHLDTDFIIHEKDHEAILEACRTNSEAPALSFYKHQYILPDRYNLKSRLVIAVNKKKYGDRIKFDGGGESDLCQPSLDGKLIRPESVPETKIEFFNYEKPIKTEQQIKDDVGRMDRAYHRHYGRWLYSQDGSDESAFEGWLKMVVGRGSKPQKRVPLNHHPLVMQDILENLTPDQFGYSAFGRLGINDYA